MSDQPYSKREIDQHFERMMESMTSFESETGASLLRIERQTEKTNGRVTKLEKYMIIVGTAVAVVIALKLPELWPLISLI